MIYIEYHERDRSMPVEIFRALGSQIGWSDDEDEMVCHIGRTLRLGSQPNYMCFWRIRGMARLDEWEEYYRSDEARRGVGAAEVLHKTVHMTYGGCYDELVGGSPTGDGLHYAEFFKAGDDVADEDVASHFKRRAESVPNAELKFVLRRIGLLGPEPGGIAVWTLPSYMELESIAREDHGNNALRPRMAGVYRQFGDEID